MNDIFHILLILTMGSLIGIVYFGGLWFTVIHGLSSRWQIFWFVVSFLIRISFALISFYYLSQGIWQNLLFGLVGLVIGRHLIVVYTKDTRHKSKTLGEEVEHEV